MVSLMMLCLSLSTMNDLERASTHIHDKISSLKHLLDLSGAVLVAFHTGGASWSVPTSDRCSPPTFRYASNSNEEARTRRVRPREAPGGAGSLRGSTEGATEPAPGRDGGLHLLSVCGGSGRDGRTCVCSCV